MATARVAKASAKTKATTKRPRRKSAPREPKRGRGQPMIVATPKQVAAVKKASSAGLSDALIGALVFHCSEATFAALKKRDERILRALREGIAEPAQKIGAVLVRKALKGLPWAVMWYEKSRLGKSDRITVGTPADMEKTVWKIGDKTLVF